MTSENEIIIHDPVPATPARIRLTMWDAKAFLLDILPQTSLEFTKTLEIVQGLPEKRYNSRRSVYRVPATPFNIKYILERFTHGEVEMDAEAEVVLRHTALTERSAGLRQKRRWEYLFQDTVPEWDWLATGSDRSKKPYRHQIVAADALRNSEFFALLMEQGTGKTAVVIEELHQMVRDRRMDDDKRAVKALVVCPTSLTGNWQRELDAFQSPDIVIWHKRLRQQANGIADLVDGLQEEADLKVWIVNYDRVKSLSDGLCKMAFDLVIYDESNAAKNPRAKRTKACVELSMSARRRCIMTGTIMANSVLDVWSQFELLAPGCLGYSSYAQFRRHYAALKKIKKWDKVVGYRDLDGLKERMARYSFIVTKERCLDLPPKVYETIRVDMPDQQADVYAQMLDTFMASLGDIATESNTVQAQAAIAQILRLTQITSGFIRNLEGETIRIPGADEKLKALVEVIEGSSGKVIVWARFREDIRSIVEALDKAGIQSVEMHGGVRSTPDASGKSARDRAVDAFNADNDIRVFVGESGTGGIGLTLLGPDTNRCRTMIYYSHDWSLMKREQSEDRAHRIGQDHKLTIYDIVCAGTIDERIVQALRDKRNLADLLKDVSTIKDFLLRGMPTSKPKTNAKESISGLRHILSSRGITIPVEPNTQPGCADFEHFEGQTTCPHCNGDPMTVPVEHLRHFLMAGSHVIDLRNSTIEAVVDA